MNMNQSTFERELIYLERAASELLTVLQSRKTKSVGKYALRIYAFARMSTQIIGRSGSPPTLETFRKVSDIRRAAQELKPHHPRERGIETLRNLADFLSSARSSTSERRVVELVDHVKKLEVQIDELLMSSEDAGTDEIQAPLDTDVSEVNSVFVIMPLSEAFSDVWSGGIVRAAKAEGFNAIRVDMIDRSSNITDDIVDSVKKCRVAIVDVTGNNPNVMFELGYALAKGKPHIIISQSAEFLPFDIRQIRTIVYSNTWSGVEELSRRIQDFLGEFKKTKPKKTPRGRGKKQNNQSKS